MSWHDPMKSLEKEMADRLTDMKVQLAHQQRVIEAQAAVVEALKAWGSLVVMNKDTDLAKRVDEAFAHLAEAQSHLHQNGNPNGDNDNSDCAPENAGSDKMEVQNA